MKPKFWRDKKVFVTGHTGFKGSWLMLWLARTGAQVRGYALSPPTQPSLFELAKLDEVVDSTVADVRDQHRLAAEVAAFAPDVVLHLAAQSVVLRSYEDPLETYATNVMGTANLLNAVRQLSNRCAVVNVTTDKVYENRSWVWGYRETDRLGGRDPYSNSKACAELVAHAFRASFFSGTESKSHIGIASARAGNVIGGGDWTPKQLIPEAIEALSQGRPVVLRHPTAIRPWQHVLDCLSGYLTLAEALYDDANRYADVWNFGPNDNDMQPVSYVVESLAKHWNVRNSWQRDAKTHAHEELELRLNSQKAARELLWGPCLTLDQALEWTATWFQRHAAGTGARALCEEQIERYMETASAAAPSGK
jgi:CDP-glucose 4,6-dehydratase